MQLSFAVLVGIGTSYFDTRLLVEALAMTCITCAAVFVIVSSTSVDFTHAGVFFVPLNSVGCWRLSALSPDVLDI